MKYIFILSFFLLGILACEQPVDLEVPFDAEQIVVEGYIEGGDSTLPPFVILTKSIPFFKEFAGTSNLYVHDATVKISNGTDTVQMTELCWQDIPRNIRKQIVQVFGLDASFASENFNLCVYIDLSFQMRGEIGKTYTLTVEKDDKKLSATTVIPQQVRLDSLDFIKPPGANKNDTQALCRAILHDPKGATFYRYFTAAGANSLVIAGNNTVFDDRFFDGTRLKFNLFKAEQRGDTTQNFETFGLWNRGDTATIKFCTIDKDHFDFWNTLEANANSQGPFSTYTLVKYNIKGDGIGVFGGYAVTYRDTIVPKN